jgi:hypothetical protein
MLWPLGGFNDCTVPNGKCMQEFFIALCGPVMHIPLMLLWVIVLSICADEGVSYYGTVGFDIDRLDEEGAGEWFSQLAKRSLDVNIMIFCLNLLLPAYPLDAANMVAAVCGHFGLSVQSTGWVLVVIGTVLGLAALIVGILYIVAGDGPGVFLLLLGLYVLYTSWQMYTQVKAGSMGHHPIFKPDCYHKENPGTNLSRSNSQPRAPPPASRTPPASPRKGSTTPSASPRKGSSTKKPPQQQQQSPKKGSTTTPKKSKKPPAKSGDIEMGNSGGPNSKKNSLPRRGSEKVKKKAPTKKAPTTK